MGTVTYATIALTIWLAA